MELVEVNIINLTIWKPQICKPYKMNECDILCTQCTILELSL